jgi:hypothetical protein
MIVKNFFIISRDVKKIKKPSGGNPMQRKKFVNECNKNFSLSTKHYGISNIAWDVSSKYRCHYIVSIMPNHIIAMMEESIGEALLDIGTM